jgi:hypothetical protein
MRVPLFTFMVSPVMKLDEGSARKAMTLAMLPYSPTCLARLRVKERMAPLLAA